MFMEMVWKKLHTSYKLFSLSETSIGKHFIKIISEEMSSEQIEEAKSLVKNFKPVYE